MLYYYLNDELLVYIVFGFSFVFEQRFLSTLYVPLSALENSFLFLFFAWLMALTNE